MRARTSTVPRLETSGRRHPPERRLELLEELLGSDVQEIGIVDGVPVAVSGLRFADHPRVPFTFNGIDERKRDGTETGRWDGSDWPDQVQRLLWLSTSRPGDGHLSPSILYVLRWGLRYLLTGGGSPAFLPRREARARTKDLQTQIEGIQQDLERTYRKLGSLVEARDVALRIWEIGHDFGLGLAQDLRDDLGRVVAEAASLEPTRRIVRCLARDAPSPVNSVCEALWSSEGIALNKKGQPPKRILAAAAFRRAGLNPRQAASVAALDVGAEGFVDFGVASDLPDPPEGQPSKVLKQWSAEFSKVPERALETIGLRNLQAYESLLKRASG